MPDVLQLELLNPAPLRADIPSGKQHRLVLVALFEFGQRGATGEECAQRAGIRYPHTATTRLEELAEDRDRFPVPLTYKSEEKRATSSGRLAHVWRLTTEGALVAGALAEEAA